ncbi:MAG: 4-(cytidine 5'-diphospho)-2-C-methyl-D-erythritol kinase, partial [Sulfurospirillum sp.]
MTTKAHAKVNIFLKITGTRGSYHLLASRFMRVENLYDTLSFVKKEKTDQRFVLEGRFGCPVEKNTIYKAYRLLLELPQGKRVKQFFHEHAVRVEKSIPEFAGLGGGSSDAAAFLRLTNDVCDLGLSREALGTIGAKIGADVPFFTSGYASANVSGIGESVKPFEEAPLQLQTVTPPVACDTAKVYQRFREAYIQNLTKNENLAKKLLPMQSADILQHYDAKTVNDLFPPALDLCPKLSQYAAEGWFFSGS